MIIFILASSSHNNSHPILHDSQRDSRHAQCYVTRTWGQSPCCVKATKEQCCALKPDSGVPTLKPGIFTQNSGLCLGRG